MKNKKMCLLLFIVGFAGVLDISANQECINVITERLVASYIARTYSDPASLMSSMRPDGGWASIDYQDTHSNQGGWSPNQHFKNLKTMAIAYRHEKSPYLLNEDLKNKIILGCEFVDKWNYPVDADNWWYNTIGDPDEYKAVLILIKGHVDTNDLKRYSKFIKDHTDNSSHKGKNRTWVSAITIHKACIEDNYSLLEKGFRSMAMPLVIVSVQGDEGIKIDGSFHQHRPQLYSGGYGLSIVSDITTYMLYCKGTLLESSFNDTHREIFSNLMLNGHLRLGYRKYMDFGSRGRNITRPGGAWVPEDDLERMAAIDPIHSEKYAAWREHLNGGPFPDPGNKYFWKSDIMTHLGKNYYLSAKVISVRTNGTECINGENTKGFNLPLGATNILTHGEEYNDIFPIWNWTRIPGTTAANNPAYTDLPGYHYGINSFGGGVSDGTFGVIAYQHDYKGLKANKAYFFMGDAMLCLGNGISATHSYPIITSVNQSYCKGIPRIYEDDGKETMVTTSKTSDNIQWAHHDNVGYIFPEKNNITVQGISQTGSWKDINNSGSSSSIANVVFSVLINHGVAPQDKTYQYIVVPDKSLPEFRSMAFDHGFVVVKNDSKAQVVRNDLLDCQAIVFYSAGTVSLDNGMSVYSNTSSLVLIKKNGAEYAISVADPTYSKSKVSLSVNKALKGDNATINGTASVTQIVIDLPSGDYVGSSVTKTYLDINDQGSNTESLPEACCYKAFPNPVHDILNINNDDLKINKVSVVNAIGKTIFSRDISDARIEIVAKDWTEGVYLLAIERGTQFYSQKIIKVNVSE